MEILQFWNLCIGKSFSGGRNITGKIANKFLGCCLNINKNRYRFLDYKRRCYPQKELPLVKILHHATAKTYLAILRLPGGFLTAITIAQEVIRSVQEYWSIQLLINSRKEIPAFVLFNNNIIDNAPGFSAQCENLTVGSVIYNVEIFPGTGAKLVRSRGTSAVFLRTKKHAARSFVRMRTGEIRKIHSKSLVCLGTVSNSKHSRIFYKNAGVIRRLGRRPVVRASAKNPVDHPMGGRTKGGCQPVSQKGILSRGPITRKIISFKQKMILLNKRQAKNLNRRQ